MSSGPTTFWRELTPRASRYLLPEPIIEYTCFAALAIFLAFTSLSRFWRSLPLSPTEKSLPEASSPARAAHTSSCMSPLKDFRAVRLSSAFSPPSWPRSAARALFPPIFPAAEIAALPTSPPSGTAEATRPATADILLSPNQFRTSALASLPSFLNLDTKSGTSALAPTTFVALPITEFRNCPSSLLRAEATVFQTFAGCSFIIVQAARHFSAVLPAFRSFFASLRVRPGSS